ncbi:MAG: MBL fold metallo-hydrolase [Methanomassiliicoccales archaeon]|jgi:L-ascorbate metabolism protein UlaG (beta-lactamase superfamily)|nr:MBL fold metallo-hydrolase [Methanomassiliicoccales archaeon]
MKIKWHGHACFEIKDTLTIITDPHDGKSLGIKPPHAKADIVLVSHDHFDHNALRIVKGDYIAVREPGERSIKDVKILGIVTAHDDVGGSKRGKNIVFAFELDGIRFCHCGDLGHRLSQDQIRALGSIDVLFLPVGGIPTIDIGSAREVVNDLAPKIVIPMHFRVAGLALSIQPVDVFLSGIPEERILRVGNEIEFAKEDLPTETEYWIFSP